MNEKPITAAELLRRTRGGLSRYARATNALTELSDQLEDMETAGKNDAWIVVRPVDGLNPHKMATATIANPAPEIDQLPEGIGHGGRITLVGMANTTTGPLPDVCMSEVLTINGTPTTRRPTPARRWWRWRRQNAPEQHAET